METVKTYNLIEENSHEHIAEVETKEGNKYLITITHAVGNLFRFPLLADHEESYLDFEGEKPLLYIKMSFSADLFPYHMVRCTLIKEI